MAAIAASSPINEAVTTSSAFWSVPPPPFVVSSGSAATSVVSWAQATSAAANNTITETTLQSDEVAIGLVLTYRIEGRRALNMDQASSERPTVDTTRRHTIVGLRIRNVGVTPRTLKWPKQAAPLIGLSLAAALVGVLGVQNRSLRAEAERYRREAKLPHPGLVVPIYRTKSLSGDTLTVGVPEAGGRQILFIFDTRCSYCISAIPAWKELSAAAGKSPSARISVYGLSLDPERETRRYQERFQLPFPIAVLGDPRMRALYRTERIPLTVVLDSSGKMVYSRLGALRDQATLDSVLSAAGLRNGH